MIKPKNQEVHIEVEMDPHSVTYDRSKGEQIAANIDGPAKSFDSESEERMFERYCIQQAIFLNWFSQWSFFISSVTLFQLYHGQSCAAIV